MIVCHINEPLFWSPISVMFHHLAVPNPMSRVTKLEAIQVGLGWKIHTRHQGFFDFLCRFPLPSGKLT